MPTKLELEPPPNEVATSLIREVRYQCSSNFALLLTHLDVSLAVSTYQAGKLVVIGTHRGSVSFGFHNFERAMGIALAGDRMAVGTRDEVWLLRSAPQIAPHLDNGPVYDNCFLTR